MAATNGKPVELEFTKLNSIISIYTPALPEASDCEPTTILFCQWMGAGPKSRYVRSFYTHYHTLYPNARIISIRSPQEFWIHTSNKSRRKLMAPVVAAIESDSAPEKRILVHLISNGGALSYLDTCHLYKEQTGKILPVKAIVLDSSPGAGTVAGAFNAFSVAFPKSFLWYICAFLCLVFLGILVVIGVVTGHQNMVDKNWALLNDWSLIDINAKRLYVYSEADKLVEAKRVEEHAKEAKEKGWDVTLLKEVGTAHVQHMMHDADRYWKFVSDLWAKCQP